MPRAELPHTPAGWLVAMVASFIGLLTGFLTVSLLGALFNGA